MNDQKEEFLLEEYRSLRSEIQQRITSSEYVETGVLGAFAVFYGWLFSQPLDSFTKLLWYIPVVLAAFGFLRYFALMNRMMEIAEYIRLLEAHFVKDIPASEAPAGSTRPFGWERYLKWKRRTLVGRAIGVTSVILWAFLIIVTGLLAYWQPSPPVAKPSDSDPIKIAK